MPSPWHLSSSPSQVGVLGLPVVLGLALSPLRFPRFNGLSASELPCGLGRRRLAMRSRSAVRATCFADVDVGSTGADWLSTGAECKDFGCIVARDCCIDAPAVRCSRVPVGLVSSESESALM